MATKEHTPVDRGHNLAKNLMLPEDFCDYIVAHIKGKILVSTRINQSASGTVSISLSYSEVEVKENAFKDTKKTRHFDKNIISADSPRKKKKSPSRRRRDKERFHLFLQRKKDRKKAAHQSPQKQSTTTEPTKVLVSNSPPKPGPPDPPSLPESDSSATSLPRPYHMTRPSPNQVTCPSPNRMVQFKG